MNNKKLYITLTLSIIFFFNCLWAQKPEDTKIAVLEKELTQTKGPEKVDILNELASAYFKSSAIDKVIEYAQQALSLCQETKYPLGRANAYKMLGQAYAATGKTEKALENSTKALLIYQKTGEKKGEGQILNNLGWIHAYGKDFDKALSYYSQSLQIKRALQDKHEIISTLANVGYTHYYLGQYQKAVETELEIMKLRQELADTDGVITSLNNIGVNYCNLSLYDQALAFYFKALREAKKSGKKEQITNLLNNIGNIYTLLNQYDQALQHHFNALKTLEESGKKIDIADSLNNIGETYRAADNHEMALKYYQRALKIYRQKKYERGIAEASRNMGNSYCSLANDQQAQQYLQNSLQIEKDIKNKYGQAQSHIGLGILYGKQGKFKLALDSLNQGLVIAKEIKDQRLIRDGYQKLSELFLIQEDYKAALKHFRSYVQTKDQIFNKESSNRIADLQARYETAKKQEKIELLQRDQRISNLQIGRQKTLTLFLVVTLALILIIAILSFHGYRNKKRSEARLKSLNTAKDKLFSVIAHDLRDPLNVLSLTSDHLKKNLSTMAKKEIHEFSGEIFKYTDQMSAILENLLYWSRSQLQKFEVRPEEIHLAELIEENVNLMQDFAERKKISLHLSVRNDCLVKVDRNMINTVIRNLMANAIKFTPRQGEIGLFCQQEDGKAVVIIEDNGIGIAEDKIKLLFTLEQNIATTGTDGEKGSGLGLYLCKDFIEKNGGKISVTSKLGQGSRFQFSLPRIS